MSQNWLLPFGRRILLLNVDVRQLRDFSADFFFVFLFFAKFLATLDPNMHETKCRGARDLRVVKFSASYGPWRSQKRPKTQTARFFGRLFFRFFIFCKVFGHAGPQHAWNEMSATSRSARRQIFSFVRPLALKKTPKNENRKNREKSMKQFQKS